MKKQIFIISLLVINYSLLFSQQWSGSANTTGDISRTGNIGIGVNTPNSKLHVYGVLTMQGVNTSIPFLDPSNSNNFQMGLVTTVGAFSKFGQPGDFVLSKVNSPGNLYISNQQSGAIHFTTGTSYSTEKIVMSIIGSNVLIGKTTQANSSYILDVNGNVRANKIVVNTTGADYVFDSGYKLISLNNLDTFLQLNHHLPNMPTAFEMQKNGIDVSENQIILLAKIEELTLYIIEQNKKQQLQEKAIENLNKKLKQQQKLSEQFKTQIKKLSGN